MGGGCGDALTSMLLAGPALVGITDQTEYWRLHNSATACGTSAEAWRFECPEPCCGHSVFRRTLLSDSDPLRFEDTLVTNTACRSIEFARTINNGQHILEGEVRGVAHLVGNLCQCADNRGEAKEKHSGVHDTKTPE